MSAPRPHSLTVALPPEARWARLRDSFLSCHSVGLNVSLHAITTPLGLYAGLVLLGLVSPWLAVGVAAVWLLSLPVRLPWAIWGKTALFTAGLVALAVAAPVNGWVALGLLIASYVGQELAHWFTREETFQSTYMSQDKRWVELAEHTWLLLPLVIEAMEARPVLQWLVARKRIVKAFLDERYDDDRARLAQWVVDREPSKEHTTHWWRLDLEGDDLAAFDRLAESEPIFTALQECWGPDFAVQRVVGMDEVYVAGPDDGLTSDNVFPMSHIDGPLAMFPFATCVRCLVALTPNERVSTHFPMTGADYQSGGDAFTLTEGDALGFDFHRELHFIRFNEGPDLGQRAVLKLHYVVAPKFLPGYASLLSRMSTEYNIRARNLFLDTLVPGSLRQRLGAMYVVGTTKGFELFTRFIGTENALYVLGLALVSLVVGSALPLVLGASFVHYLIYMATYKHRENVNYGAFLRDAVFFKGVSMATLFVLALPHLHAITPLSVVLILAGFGLAAAAAARLGPVRTYFGAELGQVEPRWISGFPYGVVPQPMILGAVVGLVGVGLIEPFAAAWPWLIPAHVGLYLLHMAQEMRAEGAHAS